jgi:hypothetical protein
MDGSYPDIKLRGVQDETHAQMNTITRLIRPENIGFSPYDPPVSVVRFDDYGHVHIPEVKRGTVLHNLDRVHQKYPVDAIVIIDLDMNCLTEDLVKAIAEFASKNGILLFVNPRHDRSKYKDIEGTAIMSSLSEWCHLVGQEKEFTQWKSRLDREEILIRMAQLSFQYLGNFTYHIVECGAAGAILMAPHPELSDRYAVYKADPHKTRVDKPKPQLSCSKLMLAVFALDLCREPPTTELALRAFKRAKAALSCYRDMPWQRMPTREAVDDETLLVSEPVIKAEPSKGMLFVPKETRIRLSEPKHRTGVPGVFSVDATFRSTIDKLMNDIQKGLEIGDPKSIILGAPSGCGKSTILKALAGDYGERKGIKLVEVKTPDEIGWTTLDAYFEKLIDDKGAKADRILIAIDEALKSTMGPELVRHGVKLLNSAHAHNVRFMFIDAGFAPGGDLPVNSEFTSRCVPYYLSGLKHRLMDISYIVAGMVFQRGLDLKRSLHSVRFEGKFLLTVINATLSHPHLRDLRTWVREAYDAAIMNSGTDGDLTLRSDHLPSALNDWAKQAVDFVEHEYEFIRPDEV